VWGRVSDPSIQAQPGIKMSFHADVRNFTKCPPERSSRFAQRSGCGVEGPLRYPSVIGSKKGASMITELSTIRTRSASVLLLLALTLSLRVQAQQKPEQLAQHSAESWLALVDSGKYADSWQEAAAMFKAAVTKEKWESMVQPVRDPLGKLLSRKLKSATYTKTLPGAPDGEYVVIQYDTSFAHKQSAVETITPMLDKDGKWRISGYFIK
jgi:Protein of unknown function (DUF4019)